MRGSARQIMSAVFGLAVLLVIVEHAGGFSSILSSGSGAFATAFQALTGHAGGSTGVATGYRAAAGGHYVR